MRVIVELFGRAWMFTVQSAKLTDAGEVSSQCGEEEYDRAPVDPHSVGGGQFERRSDFEDLADKARPPFGFGTCYDPVRVHGSGR